MVQIARDLRLYQSWNIPNWFESRYVVFRKLVLRNFVISVLENLKDRFYKNGAVRFWSIILEQKMYGFFFILLSSTFSYSSFLTLQGFHVCKVQDIKESWEKLIFKTSLIMKENQKTVEPFWVAHKFNWYKTKLKSEFSFCFYQWLF